jgi:uncharacterized protein YbjT (DUF2867 family)
VVIDCSGETRMSNSIPQRILVTGANGNLGRKLLRRLKDRPVRALVRSATARAAIEQLAQEQLFADLQIVEADYGDPQSMSQACADCVYVVHLVGIIRETRSSSFQACHVEHSRVLAQPLAENQVTRLCYLSLMGASRDSGNPCLATRGEAETLLLDSPASSLVLRIPMVLGEGDYATAALRRRAGSALSVGLRMSSLEQPIYAGDVIAAIVTDVGRFFDSGTSDQQVVELAGPESLPRRELVARSARILGTRPRVLSLPIAAALAIAYLLQAVTRYPPVSRAMLGVLDHDDCIDPEPACQQLGVALTPLDDALARCLRD